MIRGRDFATPVFRGGRFESNVLVVDVLSDLVAYRDLVVELAKHLVLRREPSRKRVPKGFVESFQIGIRAVEGGSAVSVLSRVETTPSMPWDDTFDEARDLINEVVAAAREGRKLPDSVPAEITKKFSQFGRNLRDDEYIELRRPGATTGPRYDREVRKSVLLYYDSRYEDAADVTGFVSGGVIDRRQLTIKRDDGSLVDCVCPEDLVRRSLHHAEQRVRVVGVGLYDRHDRLEKVLRVSDVVLAEELEESDPSGEAIARVNARFDELAALPQGWFDDETPPLEREGLSNVRAFLVEAVKEGVPAPHVYPTPEGEARAEWSFRGWEVSANFNLVESTVWIHASDLEGDDDRECEIDLSKPDALRDFIAFIETFPQEARDADRS